MWSMNSPVVAEQDFQFAPLAIPLLVGLVVGGVASMQGSLIGGMIVVFLVEWTKTLDDQLASAGLEIRNLEKLTPAVYGLILILVTFFAPGGIAGLMKMLKSKLVQIIPQPPAGVSRAVPVASDEVVPEPVS